MNHIIINVNIPDRQSGVKTVLQERTSRIIPCVWATAIQFPAPFSVKEADTILNAHLHIQPTEKWKQSRITVIPISTTFFHLPDKQILFIEQIGNITLD